MISKIQERFFIQNIRKGEGDEVLGMGWIHGFVLLPIFLLRVGPGSEQSIHSLIQHNRTH
jgi:hypothetical protein